MPEYPPGKPAPQVRLRDVRPTDLPIFFAHQLDPEANYMAAFTVESPTDREAFDQHWDRILHDDSIVKQTIVRGDEVAGHVASFEMFGEREVSYWLGREFWGQGIATTALRQFLELARQRPLHARAAKDNLGSLRVLEKCGFTIVGEDRGYANARCREIEEFTLRLDS